VSDVFADWMAIASLKARYCRTLDTKDWVGFASVFIEDVVIDTTASGGPRMVGREAALATIRASLETAVTVHHIHAPEIAIHGDHATGVWALHDELAWPNGRTVDGDGHYHENYVRTVDGWRIAESKLTRLRIAMQRSDDE
jgi:uncharacterized protein (TIGR02246 family)